MLILSLVLGLFFLLRGMQTLKEGLQNFAGSRLRESLHWMTATPWRGFWSGTISTALLQSSTALTVMAVSFVDAGLLPFENALGLILGSNIGSTVTTQMMALPIEQFILYIMGFGAIGYLFLKNRWRFLALAFLGLGILFLGLTLLQAGLSPLGTNPVVQSFLHNLGDHHFQGILAGTLLAALLHSSSATTGIVMLLAQDKYVTMPTALAFVFGANIGTCFTAIVSSLATSRAAKRVALFHVILNVFGVLIFLPFLNLMAHSISLMGGSLAQQVANAHTLFNILSSLLAFPLLPFAIRLLKRVF